MSKVAENIINAIKRTKKSFFTQEEIFKLVLETAKENEVNTIKSGLIELNRLDMTLSFKGKKTRLQKLTFNLLWYLMENEGKIVQREILMRDVWGTEVCVTTRTIDVCVHKLRELIGKEKIETHKKIGYRFNK
jgi:two-component system, OmpR family, alkaline phosphatase synthesis response regulator PhoP